MSTAEPNHEPDHPEAEYGRFESLLKRLISVPKAEIKRKEREQAKRKGRLKPAP
jgi:hypothetical protein